MAHQVSSDHSLFDRQILELTPTIRRVVHSRVADRETAEDLVQETLARMIEARARLDPEALGPYAIVTARNLVASLRRTELRHSRQAHRLIDLRRPELPDEESLRQEEREAVSAALDKLSTRERAAVIAHEVEEVDTATMARRLGSTPGGVATQLARARAKLRVDYLLALRRGDPPSARCRPVLIALSAGDRRRQLALDAGGHLLECDFCAGFSDPLVHRSRALAGWLPFPAVGAAWSHLARQMKTPMGQAAVATTAAATAGIVWVAASSSPQPSEKPAGPCPSAHVQQTQKGKGGTLLIEGRRVAPQAAARATSLEGRPLTAKGVLVHSVPSDEGFWIGPCAANLVWVTITGPSESGADIDAGDRVTFRGRVVAQSPAFARRVGLTPQEGAARLRNAAQHIQARSSIEVRSSR